MHNESGVIKAGAYADLLVLDRDPSEDIRNKSRINRVLREGVVVHGEDAALTEEYCPNPLWRTFRMW